MKRKNEQKRTGTDPYIENTRQSTNSITDCLSLLAPYSGNHQRQREQYCERFSHAEYSWSQPLGGHYTGRPGREEKCGECLGRGTRDQRLVTSRRGTRDALTRDTSQSPAARRPLRPRSPRVAGPESLVPKQSPTSSKPRP